MNRTSRRLNLGFRIALSIVALSTLSARAQNCQTSSDLEDAPRAAITAAGQHFFDMAAKADVASLRQNAIPSLAADFSGIENRVKDRQDDLAGSQAVTKSVFLLETEGKDPVPHAEFLCGVFGKNGQTTGSAAFYFDNLPPGKYAVVLLDATSPKTRTNFAVILQQVGADWRLADLYAAPAQIAGHDSDWFVARSTDCRRRHCSSRTGRSASSGISPRGSSSSSGPRARTASPTTRPTRCCRS